MIDNNAQCDCCGHDRGLHWTGRGCAGEGPYIPSMYGTGGDKCRCTRFNHINGK